MFESEERRIADRIKDFIKDKEPSRDVYIMLRNGRILDVDDYRKMINDGKINPQDTYVYINIKRASYKVEFYYSFLFWYAFLLPVYLSKLGFYYKDFIFPATGLKYVALAIRYEGYLAIELANLNTAASNTNLPKILVEVLGGKLVSGEKELTYEEKEKIDEILKSQKLFAGHNFNEVLNIIYKYYNEGNQSLSKEVARIVMDYYRIFNPYVVCYETKTWKEIDCWSIR